MNHRFLSGTRGIMDRFDKRIQTVTMEILRKQGTINSSESECLRQDPEASGNREIAIESREAAVPDPSHAQHPSGVTITGRDTVEAFRDSGALPGKRTPGGLT